MPGKPKLPGDTLKESWVYPEFAKTQKNKKQFARKILGWAIVFFGFLKSKIQYSTLNIPPKWPAKKFCLNNRNLLDTVHLYS